MSGSPLFKSQRPSSNSIPYMNRRRFAAFGLQAPLAALLPATGQTRKEAPISSKQSLPFLRGVNFTGLSDESWSLPPAAGASDYFLRQKRMNVVRLNFTWEFIQPTLGGALDEVACATVDTQIARATSAGAYTVLEFHNFGRRKVGDVAHVIGENDAVTREHFADAWRRMAMRWCQHDQVIFGLMNEPHDQSTAVLVDVTNAAIAAIRSAGAEQLVMVSGNNWNSLGWQPGSDNRSLMLQIRDKADNFCFDVHHYFDAWSTGKTANVRDHPIAWMEAFTDWAREHGKRGFCGEFGCHVNRRGLDACRALLRHIEDNRDVYLGWAWWGAGGPWQPDYVYMLDPFAMLFSKTNPDPMGSRDWQRPVDRPQMKMLQEFLPSDATPFNAWLIEDALAAQVRGCWRRGDYYLSATTGGTWPSSTPPLAIARGDRQMPAEREDGGVAFLRSTPPLQVNLTDDGREEQVFALIQKAPSTSVSEPRTLLGSPNGSRRVLLPPDPVDGKAALVKARRASGAIAGAERGATTIGGSDARGSDAFDGVLYDLVIIAGELSIEDQARVEGRLHWDAGLAYRLPRKHPYRVRPPALERA